MADVDFIFCAILEDLFAERVIAHEAGGVEGEGNAQFGEIDEHIVGSATRALRLAQSEPNAFDNLLSINGPASASAKPIAID